MKRNTLLLIRQFFQTLFIIMQSFENKSFFVITALLRDVQRISTMFKQTAHDEPKKKANTAPKLVFAFFYVTGLSLHRDTLDLNESTLGQRLYSHGRACRERLREELGVYLVHGSEVVHIA